MASSASFAVDSMTCGHHVSKEIWEPVNGKELPCKQEIGNSSDPLTVVVMKRIDGEDKIVGHLPHKISPLCSAFSDKEELLRKYIVNGHRRYFDDLPQGRLEVPCKLIFEVESLQVCNKTEVLIHASLAVTSTEHPEANTKCGEKPSKHTICTANSRN